MRDVLEKEAESSAWATVPRLITKRRGLAAKRQRTIRCGMWVHITAPMALLPWTANLEETGDRIFSAIVTRRLRAMGIRDKPIAPASPWRNAFAERLIGMQTF